MKQFASIVAILCFVLTNSSVWAQNSALITTINPDDLYVCGEDTMSVKIQNTGTGTLNNVVATVLLPAGIEYVAGTVNGAVEQNISNLSAPKFNIGSIGIGLNQTFNIRIIATCSLVGTINSGQLFTNKIDLIYTGGTETVSSVNYKVETGLAAIVSATPQTVAAEIGEMPIRTYVIRNTRLGPIKRIEFNRARAGISYHIGANRHLSYSHLCDKKYPPWPD